MQFLRVKSLHVKVIHLYIFYINEDSKKLQIVHNESIFKYFRTYGMHLFILIRSKMNQM